MTTSEKVWSVILVATSFLMFYTGILTLLYASVVIGLLLVVAAACLLASTLHMAARRERRKPPTAGWTPLYPGPRGTTTTDPTGLGWPDDMKD